MGSSSLARKVGFFGGIWGRGVKFCGNGERGEVETVGEVSKFELEEASPN